MKADSQEKYAVKIMLVISSLIIFPVLLTLFYPARTINPEHPSGNIFDTTLIPGFSYYSQKGIPIVNYSDTALYGSVYRLLGTPHRSRSRPGGLDCSGLVKVVFRDVYGLNLKGSSAHIYNAANKIPARNLNQGDFVVFSINSSEVNHIGIYLQNDYFAHASTSSGVTLNQLTEPYWQSHFKGAARHKSFE